MLFFNILKSIIVALVASNIRFFFNNCKNLSLCGLASGCTFALQSKESDHKDVLMNKKTHISWRLFIRYLACLAGCVLLSGSSYAQGFEVSFGGSKEDQGVAVIQMQDHGYLEIGFSEGLTSDDNDIDIFIIRTDVDGKTLWQKTYDPGFEEFPTAVIPVEGNKFLISGHRTEMPGSPSLAYLMQINEFGDLIWAKSYGSAEGGERANHIVATEDGNFLLTGTFTAAATGRRDILLRKVDAEGNEIWRRVLDNSRDQEGVGAVRRPGGYLIGANGRSSAIIDDDIQLYGVDENGNLQWLRIYGQPLVGEKMDKIISTSDGNIAFVGATNNLNTALIAKANLNGDTLWYKEINATPFDNHLHGLIEEDNGQFLVAAGEAVPDAVTLNIDILMVKVRSDNGQLVYQRLLGDDNVLNTAADLAPTVKGGYAIAAFNALENVSFNDMTLFNTDAAGEHLTNRIRGRVFHAINGCGQTSPNDFGLGDWLLRAESENAVFFGSTDSLGFYDLQVDTGTYTLTLLQKNDRWEICQPAFTTLSLAQIYDSTRYNFPLVPAIDCPLLSVVLTAGPATACDLQTITVRYGNQGASTASGVSVELELDEILAFLSSSIPLSNQSGQQLTFELPDLAPSQYGSFDVNVAVGCAAVVNQQAVSSSARILPVFNCSPIDPNWDGSSISVSSQCTETGIIFQITNIGENPMTQPSRYVVIEDIILVREAPFNLASQGVEQVEIPFDGENNGATFRIIAEQPNGHPGSLFPTAVVEGCSTNTQNTFTTGFVAQFPDNDGELNFDILTQEVFVLNSSEPLALRAYPKGYQDSIITPTTDLEYTIFFSLDSNEDTIGRVVIRDTLSQKLDLNSLEMGAASHPYDFTLYQSGVLKITFDSIQLLAGGGTGGANNAPSQQGFVSFRLSQKPNNTVGDVISNRAAVYFDYRQPMSTNATRHLVGCQQLFETDCLLTSTRNFSDRQGVIIHVFPNPMQTHTMVSIKGLEEPNATHLFTIYDLLGRKVQQHTFQGDQTQLLRQNLPSAAYFYELRTQGKIIGKGKLFIQ